MEPESASIRGAPAGWFFGPFGPRKQNVPGGRFALGRKCTKMLEHSLIFDGALPGEDAETADIHFLLVFIGQSGPDPSKMQVWEGFRAGLPEARQPTLIFYLFLQWFWASGAKMYENHYKKHGF